MTISWILFGSSQNWIILRRHFYTIEGIFLRSSYRMGGGVFLGLLKLQIFLEGLEIPDIFFW